MFFRTKTIKNTPLVQLVESYRNAEGKPRQRIVASLGRVDIPEKSKRTIARAVEARLRGQQEFFPGDYSPEEVKWIDQITHLAERTHSAQLRRGSETLDGVLAGQVETEHVVSWGPELVGMKAWEALGLTEKLLSMGMNRKTAALAQAMVINRLVEPLSEWAMIEWLEGSALPECLNVRVSRRTKDRLYRTSDELWRRREKLEADLRRREAELFGSRRRIVLYDLTNTHFEGVCGENPKARRGRNKQKRNDCLQVAVGIAFDEQGNALSHEVFEGNISDSKTLFRMLEKLDGHLGERRKTLVILDAGIATKGNLEKLREAGYSYLINVTRGSRGKYTEYFEEDGFESLRNRDLDEQIEVRRERDPELENGWLVLCRSMKRRQKEDGIFSRAEKRFLEEAAALRKRVAKGQLKDLHKIHNAIGRLQKSHPRVARYYQIELRDGDLRIEVHAQKRDRACDLHGCYVLKTDCAFDAQTLWNSYMMLLKAEEGFKLLKGTLGLRPNFHRKEHRVDGHIFITVLAYHLLNWICKKLEQAGDRRTWRTIRRLLRTHIVATTRFPLEDGRVISVRKPSRPDESQIQVYRALGINWNHSYTPRKMEFT